MNSLHRWDLSPTEAVALQRVLSRQVRLCPLATEPETIAGADISFHRFSNIVDAGIVVLRLRDLSILDTSHVRTTAPLPYIPGLLSFREAPPLLEAWEKLQIKPDVLILDGHGTAHPRRFGLACHLSLWLDLPTIGCAKQRLTGQAAPPPQGNRTITSMKSKEYGDAKVEVASSRFEEFGNARVEATRCCF